MSLITKVAGLAIPAWVYEVIVGILLTVGTVLYLEHKGASRELVKLEHSSSQLIEKAHDDIARETTAHTADVKATTEKLNAALATNNVLSAQLTERVRLFDAYRRAHPDLPRPASGPAVASPGECGAQSCGDLASSLAQAGNELAASNGSLSATLQSCQRDRDSLTGLPK